jgi:hypothetical protein
MDMNEAQRREEWRQLNANEHAIVMWMESPDWVHVSSARQAEVAAFHNELVAWLNVVSIQMDQLSQRFDAFEERLQSMEGEDSESV